MTEIEETKVQRYQWVKGDHIGKVETVKDTDGEWTLFEGGGRISTSLIGEFMTPIGEGEEVIQDDFSIEVQPPQSQVTKTPKQADHESPIMKLLKGMKNPANKKLTVTVDVKIPNEATYNLLMDSFEGAEEEILKFVMNQVDTKKVIESVQDTIKKNYNSH